MSNRIIKYSKGAAFFIVFIFVMSSATAMTSSLQEQKLSFVKKTGTQCIASRDEFELKYYDENTLNVYGGIDTPGLVIWKSAIRLTQKEMANYMEYWTMTKVNVAFTADQGCSSIDVRIYIYDKGTAICPGLLIADDTTYTLHTTGITTIPLTTPVQLKGHEELWVAVEWRQENDSIFAVGDAGPAVDGKGDWIYLNGVWQEIQCSLDSNWGIGAIINGSGLTQLMIGNIKGLLGIQTDVRNIGLANASNVSWSTTATGGMLGRVHAYSTGMTSSIVPNASTPISSDIFIGFGKIRILITAKAKNAAEVTETKYAVLLGPFVIGVR